MKKCNSIRPVVTTSPLNTLTLEIGGGERGVDHLLRRLEAVQPPEEVTQVEAEGEVLAAALDGRLVVGDGALVEVRLDQRLAYFAN